MTRGKDVFWAVLAAGLPLAGTLSFGWLSKYFEAIINRTYAVMPYYGILAVLIFVIGAALAAVTVRFFSNPRETSSVPFIGLAVGWGISAAITLCFMMPFYASRFFVFTGVMWTYGSIKDILFLGFYTVLLFWYWKHHTLVTAEDLKKEIEEA